MGDQCSSICDRNSDNKNTFRNKQMNNPDTNRPINFDTKGKMNASYFSKNCQNKLIGDLLEEDRSTSKDIQSYQEIGGTIIIKYKSGIVYSGEINDKREKNGYGVQKWPDGAGYEGHWKNDKANGKGKFVHPDGDFYDGEWVDNKAEGIGRYQRKIGGYYEGGWRKDQPDGFGVQQWGDGNIYKGDFKNGLKHGHGVYKWSDGSSYDGEWKEGKISGSGVYKHFDGRVYEGSWLNNMMHGFGTYTWKDGRKYVGNYEYDKKSGFGKYFWNDGRVFQGYWADGKRNGDGKILYPDGSFRKGQWVNDKRVDENGEKPEKDRGTLRNIRDSSNRFEQNEGRQVSSRGAMTNRKNHLLSSNKKTYSQIHGSASPRKY